jgi:hypothetical protein
MLISSWSSRLARWSVFAAGLMPAASVQAQSQFDGVSVERMRLATDRSGIASVEGGRVQEHLDWEGGLWFGWAGDPLVAYRLSDGARVATLVGNRFSGSAVASIGLFGGAQLGFELPFVMSQQRYGGGAMGDLPALSSAAVGNVRLVPKLQLLYQRVDGVDLAVLAGFTVPLGSASSFAGSSDVTVNPEVALSRSFGDLRLAAAVGATVRRAHSLANVAVGSEIEAQAGVAYSLKRRVKVPLELGAALAAATSASRPLARERETPAELRAIASYDVTRALQLFTGGGVGLTSGWGTPGWRALAGFRMALAPWPALPPIHPAPISAARTSGSPSVPGNPE